MPYRTNNPKVEAFRERLLGNVRENFAPKPYRRGLGKSHGLGVVPVDPKPAPRKDGEQ